MDSNDATSVNNSTAYRPTVAPRNLVIQRTNYGNPGAGGTLASGGGTSPGSTGARMLQYAGSSTAPIGAYAAVTSSGVGAVRVGRERDKKDMQDLNERFASYIEKVRFLEAANRKLSDELETLQARWGRETTQVKAMFEEELKEARRLLDESDKERTRLDIKVNFVEEQNDELRSK